MIKLPSFIAADSAPHFDACIEKIGSFSEAARRLGLRTAWGVQKWRADGVPHDRVIPFASLAGFVRTPHQLRPDLYPHPDDGLPSRLRLFGVLDEFSEVLTQDERAHISCAISSNRPDDAIRMIGELDVAVSVRAALLVAAQRAQSQDGEGSVAA